MNSLFGTNTGIFIAIAFGIAVFLVLREILTWYWKFTKMVDLLEKIERNTRPAIPPVSEDYKKEPATLSGIILKGFLPGDDMDRPRTLGS